MPRQSSQRVSMEFNLTTVRELRELDWFNRMISANGSDNWSHGLMPMLTGGYLRLTYLLYRGSPPDTLIVESVYREMYLWINISSRWQCLVEVA